METLNRDLQEFKERSAKIVQIRSSSITESDYDLICELLDKNTKLLDSWTACNEVSLDLFCQVSNHLNLLSNIAHDELVDEDKKTAILNLNFFNLGVFCD